MGERVVESQEQVQESMWIEIIKRMETIYAELANSQAEIERKNRELIEAKEFTDNIIRSMIDALIVVDSHGNIKMVNRATLDLLGYEEKEIIGRPMEVLFANEDRKPDKSFKGPCFKRLIEEGSVQNLEVDFHTKGGERIPMALSGSVMRDSTGEVIGVVGVAKDLREMKKLVAEAAAAEAERAKAAELEKAYKELQQLQEQLIQSEKMASIGELAAGVAHELNNPLTGILTFSHLLLKNTPEHDAQRADLQVIVDEAVRCKRIVQGLLGFARQKDPEKSPSDINKIIEESLMLLQNQAAFHNIRIIKELNSRLPLIMVDAGQIKQVFMNIILNAAQAMPEGGSLTINTGARDNFIEVKFIDTGCGIPEENIHRLFDPFFTTKA
ncbi:MAG TPA: PAS domain S-box protein, partial [Candidatus Latescibacteria bacterium]|nr:PAS domain S-box protein [Candidatus Latescibacterota bacterium]